LASAVVFRLRSAVLEGLDVSKMSEAAFAWMEKYHHRDVSSDELWRGLQAERPDLATKTPARKTPRTTCMRDLRKDTRFVVAGGRVMLR
jgi:hypothetical protein